MSGVAAWNVLIRLVSSHSDELGTMEGLRAMGVLAIWALGGPRYALYQVGSVKSMYEVGLLSLLDPG